MPSKFHKKAISRITPEARALMIKSLEIISQIQAILERRSISQKQLATMLDISQPAVSKMLSPGGNLEMNTIVKLEMLLGETILTTPQKYKAGTVSQKYKADTVRKVWLIRSQLYRANRDFTEVDYSEAEPICAHICVN
jgi:predicted XRE-type DNA-binding protein